MTAKIKAYPLTGLNNGNGPLEVVIIFYENDFFLPISLFNHYCGKNLPMSTFFKNICNFKIYTDPVDVLSRETLYHFFKKIPAKGKGLCIRLWDFYNYFKRSYDDKYSKRHIIFSPEQYYEFFILIEGLYNNYDMVKTIKNYDSDSDDDVMMLSEPLSCSSEEIFESESSFSSEEDDSEFELSEIEQVKHNIRTAKRTREYVETNFKSCSMDSEDVKSVQSIERKIAHVLDVSYRELRRLKRERFQ